MSAKWLGALRERRPDLAAVAGEAGSALCRSSAAAGSPACRCMLPRGLSLAEASRFLRPW